MATKDEDLESPLDPEAPPSGPPANATIRNREVILSSPNSRAKLDAPFRSGVVIPGGVALTARQRSLVAGYMEQPIAWVDDQVQANRPLVLKAGLQSDAAQRFSDARVAEGLPTKVIHQWGLFKTLLVLGGGILAGSAVAVFTNLVAYFSYLLIGAALLAFLGLAASLVFATLFLLGTFAVVVRQRAKVKHADGAWDDARSATMKRQGTQDDSKVRHALYAIRRKLPQSGLPDIAKDDIIALLETLESALANQAAASQPEALHQILVDIESQLALEQQQGPDIQNLLDRLTETTRLGREAVAEPGRNGPTSTPLLSQ